MGVLPPFLQDGKLHNICLVLEGYEEYYYFNRILDFPCFKGTYHVELRNAKAASNIPSIFQAAYAKNFYEIIFVVCDKDRKPEQYMLYPELGEKARNNGHVVYSLDFEVTPHLLRHTYITNLIHASVDPKTVQYLAGHENSRITMDIYAKVKYNRPDDVVKAMTSAFAEWDAS